MTKLYQTYRMNKQFIPDVPPPRLHNMYNSISVYNLFVARDTPSFPCLHYVELSHNLHEAWCRRRTALSYSNHRTEECDNNISNKYLKSLGIPWCSWISSVQACIIAAQATRAYIDAAGWNTRDRYKSCHAAGTPPRQLTSHYHHIPESA